MAQRVTLLSLCFVLLVLGASAGPISRWTAFQQGRLPTSTFSLVDVTFGSGTSSSRSFIGQQQQQHATENLSKTRLFSATTSQTSNDSEINDTNNDGSFIRTSDLSREQLHAAHRALQGGENLFLTGAAGTGKSFLLRYVIQEFYQKSNRTSAVAVTAPTGIAAINIGGSTIHSFAGIGLGKGDAVDILNRVLKNKRSRLNWKRASVLVMDEVSMLSSDLFELLDFIGREVRGCQSLPFGGLQLIFCGDFCQLPPVRGSFAFQSSLWHEAGLNGRGTVVLKTVHRQAHDPQFVSMLNELRWGALTDQTHLALDVCHVQHKPVPEDGIVPTKLYCRNVDVDMENEERLAELPSRLVEVKAIDTFTNTTSKAQEKGLLDIMDKRIAQTLRLKVGAQVVLLRNRPGNSPLKNGSRGVIVSFDDNNYPTVRFDCGITETIKMVDFLQGNAEEGYMVRMQLPLKLAWALTVHRAQGMTLSRVQVMLDGAFAPGQAYVALSRATSINGLYMNTRLQRRDVRAHPEVISYYTKALNGATKR